MITLVKILIIIQESSQSDHRMESFFIQSISRAFSRDQQKTSTYYNTGLCLVHQMQMFKCVEEMGEF